MPSPISIGKETLYTIEEIAAAYGVSEVTIRALIRGERLPGTKIGRRWYVRERDYQRFLKATPRLGTRGPKRQNSKL